MEAKELIKIVHNTSNKENQLNEIAEKLLNLFCVNNCPDLSDVWNLAVLSS